MDGREDAHGHLVRVLAGDALVHVEQVAVAFLDDRSAQALDGFGEVQVDRQSGFAYAAAFVAHLLGVPRGHIARHQVAEAGILALQEIIALGGRNLARRPFVALFQRHPYAPVVAQRFAHQGELALVFAGNGNAGGVNLGEARVSEQRAAFVRAPDGRGVAALGIGGEVIYVAVAAGAQHHGIGQVRFDLAGDQIAGDNAAGAPVDHDQVEHLGAREHRHLAAPDLLFERLVGAQQELLAGLAAGIKRTRYLGAAETAIVQVARVFARERNALRHALIDDVEADLRQAVDVGFAGAEIAALHRVVEEPEHAIAVIVIVFGGVDSALRRDAVRAPGRILEAETLHVVAEFGQRGRAGSACQAGTYNDDRMLPLVRGIDQFQIELMPFPSGFDRARWTFRVELHAHRPSKSQETG